MDYFNKTTQYIKEHIYYFTILFSTIIIAIFTYYYIFSYQNLLDSSTNKSNYVKYNIDFHKISPNHFTFEINDIGDFLNGLNTELQLGYEDQLIDNLSKLDMLKNLEDITYSVEIQDFILKKYLTIKPINFRGIDTTSIIQNLIKDQKVVIFVVLGFSNDILQIDIADFNGYIKNFDSNKVLSTYIKGFNLINRGGEYTLNIDSFGIINSNYPNFHETQKSIIKNFVFTFDDEEIYNICVDEANIKGYYQMFGMKELYLGECTNKETNSIKYLEYSSYTATTKESANETSDIATQSENEFGEDTKVVFDESKIESENFKELDQNEINIKFDNYYSDRKIENSFKLNNVVIDSFDGLEIANNNSLNNIKIEHTLLLNQNILNEENNTLAEFQVDLAHFNFKFLFQHGEFILQ